MGHKHRQGRMHRQPKNHAGFHYNRTKIETKQVSEGNPIANIVTGKNDAVFIRNKFQTLLDYTYSGIVNHLHFLEEQNIHLRKQFEVARTREKDIKAVEEEREALFIELNNLLNKETNFEKKMWKTTQKGNKVDSITIKQKFKDSDIDEIKYDSMRQYLDKYPEYASKPTFSRVLHNIEEKEKWLRRQKQEYNEAVGKYSAFSAPFEKDIQKAEDKFNDYDKYLTEGTEKIQNSRYLNGMFYKLLPEKEKDKLKIDTTRHKIEQFRNTMNLIKKEHSKNAVENFAPIKY